MRDKPGKTASEHDQRRILDVNEALLVTSVRQHELAELAQRAEAAARESEERYRTLFDLGPVAVYSCDVSGVIRDFNRVAAELWGLPADAGGYPCFRLVCYFRDISESVIARE